MNKTLEFIQVANDAVTELNKWIVSSLNDGPVLNRAHAANIVLTVAEKIVKMNQTNLVMKVERIKPLLQQLASNPRLMQLAGPARQALNILKE